MNLAQLKTTSDTRFEENLTFEPTMPDGTPADFTLTIKSMRNNSIKAEAVSLINKIEKITNQLDSANASKIANLLERSETLEKKLCQLILVGFDNLYDGKQKLEATAENKDMLVNDYKWLRDAMVLKATDQLGFFTEKSKS